MQISCTTPAETTANQSNFAVFITCMQSILVQNRAAFYLVRETFTSRLVQLSGKIFFSMPVLNLLL